MKRRALEVPPVSRCVQLFLLVVTGCLAGALGAQTAVESPVVELPSELAPATAPPRVAEPAPTESARPSGDDPVSVVDSGTNGDIFMTSPWPFGQSGIVLQSKPSWPWIATKTGTSDANSGFTVNNSSNTELMRVRSDGKVGIGTASPNKKLHIHDSTDNQAVQLTGTSTGTTATDGFIFSAVGTLDAQLWSFENGFMRFGTNGIERMRIDSAGSIGIGTTAPRSIFHIARNAAGTLGPELILENNANSVGDAEAITFAANTYARAQIRSRVEGSPFAGTLEFHTGLINLSERMRITGAGDVGIGTIPNVGTRLHVAGNALVAGNLNVTGAITGATVIGATYQDVAEWVPAKSDMVPGTVVILNPEVNNEVMPSSDRYDVRVAGVVSHQPGLILGVAGDAKEQIATTGRVLVKVDATAAPIRIGDLLVTSDKPGMAMRSDAIEIQGRKFHQPGTIIGKALEPLAGGEGEILVLLSLQ